MRNKSCEMAEKIAFRSATQCATELRLETLVLSEKRFENNSTWTNMIESHCVTLTTSFTGYYRINNNSYLYCDKYVMYCVRTRMLKLSFFMCKV